MRNQRKLDTDPLASVSRASFYALTHAALSTGGRAKIKLLSVPFKNQCSPIFFSIMQHASHGSRMVATTKL